MNYTELSTAIQDYTSNYEVSFVAHVPDFIRQAEQRIYNSVQFPSLRKNATGTLAASTRYLTCPQDFLAPYSFAVINSGTYAYLLNKDANFILEAYPTPTSTAIPEYYGLYGPCSDTSNKLAFILGPTPDSNYSVELNYFYYPESITTVSTGETWLGENFDSVLLYGSLIEAYTYMKGEQDMLTLYDTKYKEALALAKRLGDGLERRDAYRSGQTRIEVP